jgi:hypothetical protein
MSSNDKNSPPDPVFINARREAIVILIIFALFGIYTLSVSYWQGLATAEDSSGSIRLVLGMPAWVFWGIVLPWLAANVVTAWFCFAFMRDDEVHPSDQETSQAAASRQNTGEQLVAGSADDNRPAVSPDRPRSAHDSGEADV